MPGTVIFFLTLVNEQEEIHQYRIAINRCGYSYRAKE